MRRLAWKSIGIIILLWTSAVLGYDAAYRCGIHIDDHIGCRVFGGNWPTSVRETVLLSVAFAAALGFTALIE